MRPILALSITVFLLGGVYAYIEFAESLRQPATAFEVDYATGNYSASIERTFDCQSLKVFFLGKPIIDKTGPVPADEKIEIDTIDELEIGQNEFYIRAFLDAAPTSLCALKVLIKRDGKIISESLLSNEPGLAEVSGPVVFKVLPAQSHDDHNH
ncbi:MAG: hypothetical protein AB8B55_09865 [Mariniblastus sp.]